SWHSMSLAPGSVLPAPGGGGAAATAPTAANSNGNDSIRMCIGNVLAWVRPDRNASGLGVPPAGDRQARATGPGGDRGDDVAERHLEQAQRAVARHEAVDDVAARIDELQQPAPVRFPVA